MLSGLTCKAYGSAVPGWLIMFLPQNTLGLLLSYRVSASTVQQSCAKNQVLRRPAHTDTGNSAVLSAMKSPAEGFQLSMRDNS